MFKNRIDAGRKLAQRLKGYKNLNPVVLGLPRGGVPVAQQVAKELEAPLDILIVKKIGVPMSPELAAGAICEGEEPIFNQDIMRMLSLTRSDLEEIISEKRETIRNLQRTFRSGKPLTGLRGETIILVDDGIATGATVRMAIKALRKMKVKKIILAVPVAPHETLEILRPEVDELICLQAPQEFYAVGDWYSDFTAVSDNDVAGILNLLKTSARSVVIEIDDIALDGDLNCPDNCSGWVIFVHGSGSSHKSERNRMVANVLNQNNFATLLFDLLTEQEEMDRQNVFDIDLLTQRLKRATRWLKKQPEYKGEPIAYFGASTGAAAALAASALQPPGQISTVISRGGRPDLAKEYLSRVSCPVLLIVGEWDDTVIDLNKRAERMLNNVEFKIIPMATHLFSEPDTLDEVAKESALWLKKVLQKAPAELKYKSQVALSSTWA